MFGTERAARSDLRSEALHCADWVNAAIQDGFLEEGRDVLGFILKQDFRNELIYSRYLKTSTIGYE